MLVKRFYIIFFILFSFLFARENTEILIKKINSLPKDKKIELLIKLAHEKANNTPQENLIIGKELVNIGKKSNDSRLRILGLQTMGFGYGCTQNLKKAFEMYNKSLNCAKSTSYIKGKAITYSEMSNLIYFFYNKNHQKGIEYYKKAINAFRKNNDIYGEARFKNKTASIFIRLGEYEKAVKLYISTLQDLEKLKINYREENFAIVGNIANITCSIGNLKIAEKYINRFESMLNKNRNYHYKVQLLYLKSRLSFYKKNYKKALYLINRSLLLHKSLSDNLSLLSNNRVKLQLIEHKIIILLKTGKLNETIKLIKDMEVMTKETPDFFISSKILYLRSEYYYKSRKFNPAVKTGLECVTLCKKYNFNGELIKIYSKLIKYFLEQKKTKLSLKYLKEKRLLEKDKLNSRLPADIMAIIFDYENKNTLKKLGKVKKHISFIILLFFILILLVSGIGFFAFKTYKRKYKITFDSIKKELEILKSKSSKKGLSKEKSKFLMVAIKNTIREKELFLDPDFNLEALSEIMGINHYYLSSVINSNWGNNFNDLINTLRIERAKKILQDPKYLNIKTIDICFEVGFNSSTTFYRVFKEKVNMSPKQYRKINISPKG
jgi:AraC-like DNA-binding protein